MAENLTDLHRQREDIKILLSTLEEAFRDASITEEHYNEVKGKNQKKLEELEKRIAELENQSAAPSLAEPTTAPAAEPEPAPASEAPAEPEPRKNRGGRPRKPKQARPRKKPGRPKKEASTKPSPHGPPAESPAAPPVTPPSASPPGQPDAPSDEPAPEPSGDYSGVPQALTAVAGADEALETKPDKAPGGSRRFGEPGTVQYTAGEIKEMLNKVLKEIKPQGLEVAPRVDKLEVALEKVRAYIEAMKDERSGGKENLQRLNEELGEVRSSVSGIDRKVSESDMKVQEISEAIGDLRPKRFIKAMEETDKSLKMHDARLDKLDDLNSVLLKKIGQIEEVLKRLGSLEKIVNFSKEAAKRLLEIENREKKINRIADKIDGIFMELNKRLDEFVLYKAKQDTLDELSQEMMKNLDEISTKVEKYASKADLDTLKEMLETEIANIRTSSGTSPAVQKLQSQKTEIEGLIAMLDEQFKSGGLPEKEYKKTKQINQERLADLDKKIAEAQSGGSVPEKSPEQWAAEAKPAQPSEPAPAQPAEPQKETPPAPQETSGPGPENKEPSSQISKTESAAPGKESPAQEPGKPETTEQLPGPEPGSKPTEKAPETNQPQGTSPEDLHRELEESHKDGLISDEAKHKTKSLFGGARGLFGKKSDKKGED